ncbi:MAG: oxidoreductase [Chloroflexi bacterium]|nr:MAG: oxidoreductase [Chloroflexota bacterium]
MWEKYFIVNNLHDAVELYSKYTNSAKLISGGTDLLLEIERGLHPAVTEIIDISRIEGLDQITIDNKEYVHIGPLATHNHCFKSKIIQKYAACLFQACAQVGSPQIRNRGTIIGNVVTASPANDTISALMVLNAKIVLASNKGIREIEINDFYSGVRKTKMEPGEIVTEIYFKGLSDNLKSVFYKHALRRAQAISVLNVSVVINIIDQEIFEARIAIGAVAPTVIRANKTEKYLLGKKISDNLFVEAGKIASEETSPITDIRSSANYRRKMVSVLVKRGLDQAAVSKKVEYQDPVVLWGQNTSTYKPMQEKSLEFDHTTKIEIEINGKTYEFINVHKKNLLDLIRENALLTGTKEGCGEGECGACTVFLDGIAVMGCLVPAARAHRTKVVTIEGITQNGQLHRVQDAFIQEGAIQCGYCSPGFVMSAVKLLEEKTSPSKDEIKQAITGNLCRCTGYYKILSAIEKASEK